MRTLAITQNVTVDGSVEMLTDWFDPQDQNDELLRFVHEQDERCDAVLLGRETFVGFRGYRRENATDTTGISAYLDGVDKYVVSSTLTDAQWQNSTILRGDVLEEVRRLKEAPGRDIVVTGSISLAHALLAAELVDELRLFTYPAVQGGGRRGARTAGRPA